MEKQIKIGIVGCGFVGGALKTWIEDVNAFAKLTEGLPLGDLLAPLHRLNIHFRGGEERI